MNYQPPRYCPDHPQGKPLQQYGPGTRSEGQWYCPNKVGPGPKDYCQYPKTKNPMPVATPPAAQIPPSWGGPSIVTNEPAPAAVGGLVDHRIDYIPLAVAALGAAQYLSLADGGPAEAALLQSAQRIFAAMKAML